MRFSMYLDFFFICDIFSQEISTFSQENIQESSHLNVRKKRLIDKSKFGDRPFKIGQVPYIVNIHKNGKTNCAGSILSPKIIITAAHCVEDPESNVVLSGSSYEYLGMPHNVTEKIIHSEYHPHLFPNDLALLIINPPINLVRSPNRAIALHIGDIPENSPGIISGWGSNHMTLNETRYPDRLRSITVPIMSLMSCREVYESVLEITDRNICTFDRSFKKRCGEGDSGDPLVIANRLVGTYAGSVSAGIPVGPDIFIHLSHPVYRNWIFSYVPPNPPNSPQPPHSHTRRTRI